MATLEGFAARIHVGDLYTPYADHTWVRADLGNGNYQYFNCWSSHDGPFTKRIVGGSGSYNWANCCRCPLGPFPDTAGIGIYGVDGVCHQSANCFLYTAGKTLNFNVRGYFFTLLSFGTYGRRYLQWLQVPYGYCSRTTPRIAAAGAQDEMADRLTENVDPAIEIVRRIYASVTGGGFPKTPDELLADEAAQITKLFAPDINPDKFRDIHLNYLTQREELISTGKTGEELAKLLDDLERKTQQELEKRLGGDQYQRLMGIPAGQTLGLIEPKLMAAVGTPTPALEVLLKGSTAEKAHGANR